MLKLYVKVFYVMGKALSGELSCPCDRSCFINEDVAQVLLMFKVLFTKDSKVEYLFCDAPTGSEQSLFICDCPFGVLE